MLLHIDLQRARRPESRAGAVARINRGDFSCPGSDDGRTNPTHHPLSRLHQSPFQSLL